MCNLINTHTHTRGCARTRQRVATENGRELGRRNRKRRDSNHTADVDPDRQDDHDNQKGGAGRWKDTKEQYIESISYLELFPGQPTLTPRWRGGIRVAQTVLARQGRKCVVVCNITQTPRRRNTQPREIITHSAPLRRRLRRRYKNPKFFLLPPFWISRVARRSRRSEEVVETPRG